MKPVRIQRKRTKGFNLQAASPNGLPVVYVGRPTKWGNPYLLTPGIKREEAVSQYKFYLPNIMKFKNLNIEELRGKNLACFCKLSDSCHADVLLELANR